MKANSGRTCSVMGQRKGQETEWYPCDSGLDEWLGSEVITRDWKYRERKAHRRADIWPDGNVQQAAADPGLRLREREVRCYSLWYSLISQRGSSCLGEKRSATDFALDASLGCLLLGCGKGLSLFHMQCLT